MERENFSCLQSCEGLRGRESHAGACGEIGFTCLWGERIHLPVGREDSPACGERGFTCLWGERIHLSVGREDSPACGERGFTCLWGERIHLPVGREDSPACGAGIERNMRRENNLTGCNHVERERGVQVPIIIPDM